MDEDPTPQSDDLESDAVAPPVVTPRDTPADTPDETPDEVVAENETFNVMSIESVLFDLSDSSPLVHLIEEESPYRYLAIPIALTEAVALHNALDKIDGRRPATHELAS